MKEITTHILDTATGLPASGIAISLHRAIGDAWLEIANAVSNSDGRAPELLNEQPPLVAGTYRMHFKTADYLQNNKQPVFYPWVDVVFRFEGHGAHYHIPLLLSPFGYSTYRGS